VLEWFRTLTFSKPYNLQVFCSLKTFLRKQNMDCYVTRRKACSSTWHPWYDLHQQSSRLDYELHIDHKVQKNVNVITEGTNICACMTLTVHDSNWHVGFSFLSTCLLQGVDAQAQYSRHLRCTWNVATGTERVIHINSCFSSNRVDVLEYLHNTRNSVIGIATCYGLDGSCFESRRLLNFLSFTPVQTGPGVLPVYCAMCTGSFPGVKWQ